MMIEDARKSTGSNMFDAWLYMKDPAEDGYAISFNSGFQPDGVLGRPIPVDVSPAQLEKLKNCIEVGLPFEVKPTTNHRVRIYVY